MLEISDEDLLSRLMNFEDNFVERKSASDKNGWLRTAVAFANSVPVDYPGILFIGVRPNGSIEESSTNFDSLQITINQILNAAFPPIYCFPKVLKYNGRQFLAVVVPGSRDRPHFSGKSYVRVGSESKEASDTQFEALVAMRNSKAYEILKWKGKKITVDFMNLEHLRSHGPISSSEEFAVGDCNQFFVTLDNERGQLRSFPLYRVEISFFHGATTRLKLEIRPV